MEERIQNLIKIFKTNADGKRNDAEKCNDEYLRGLMIGYSMCSEDIVGFLKQILEDREA